LASYTGFYIIQNGEDLGFVQHQNGLRITVRRKNPVWSGTLTLKKTSYFWSLFNILHLKLLIDPGMPRAIMHFTSSMAFLP